MTASTTKASGIAPGTVLDVGDLAPHSNGAIVSRTLVKSPTGTLTLFAFAEGQCLSEHTAPFDAFAHVLEGEAQISIDGKPLSLRAGQAVLMPANIPHALNATTAFKMTLAMFKSGEQT